MSCLTFSQISNIPATPVSATRHKRSKGSKGDLLKIDTLLLAEHLCIHEQKLYSRIRVSECLNWVKSPVGNGVKHLAAFNAFNEKLCAWVKTSILNTESTGKRADTIDFWIKIAEVSELRPTPTNATADKSTLDRNAKRCTTTHRCTPS